MTIGEKLKRARKKLDYDLDDVAKSTKIAKMFLIAIENDELSSLPGGVYTRNFIRAYAKHLQLDEDIITAEYHDQYEVKPHFVEQLEQTKSDDVVFRQQRRYNVLVVTIISLVALAGLVAFFYPQLKGVSWLGGQTAPGNSESPSTVTTAPPESLPAPTRDQAAPTLASETQPVEPQEVDKPAEAAGSPLVETESDLGEKTNVAAVEQPADERPTTISQPGQLPMSDLLQGNIVNGQPEDAAQVFAIEALTEVRVQVTIDGTIVTKRLLMPGQVRVYAYGNYNSLLIENGSAAIQTDTHFYGNVDGTEEALFLKHFAPGRLNQVLTNKGLAGLEIQ